MELREHASAEAFLEALHPMWAPREAELNLLVGIACTIRNGWIPERGALLATLEREGRAIAAVLRTPPHGFIVAEGAPGAAAELARVLARSDAQLDSNAVIATSPVAEEFARAWTGATNRSASLTTPQRIYALEAVVPPPRPAGRFRRAETSDADTIAPWFHAFVLEAAPHEAGERDATIALARARIEQGIVYVWEQGDAPVSMAMLARPTPNGITLTSVYTPPALRGNGFAAACVAALSQEALDSGKRFACLYTDAANPTSNALYERIGYRKVCDSELWSFT